MEHARRYLPAAGHDWALPFYDPLVRLFGGDVPRRTLVERAAIAPDHRVLDVGCGTGTLLASLARAHPTARLTGIDPDPLALARARRKVPSAHLDRGFSDALPHADRSFDRVLSSYVLHHLEDEEKAGTMREIARVLAPGGEVHLLDLVLGSGHGLHGRGAAGSDRHARESDPARVVEAMRAAGLRDPVVALRRRTLLGEVAFFRACAPA